MKVRDTYHRVVGYDQLAPEPTSLKGKGKKRSSRTLRTRQALSEGKRGAATITLPKLGFLS